MYKQILVIGLVLICTGCSQKEDIIITEGIEEYNNELITIQEQSVEALESYYKDIEVDYDDKNLLSLYSGTLNRLSFLQQQAESISGRYGDDSLKESIVDYITGIQTLFIEYENPILEVLLNYSGSAQGFYESNKNFFSESSMKLAANLVELDKKLEEDYASFSKKYGYKTKNKKD